jgi:hypothetical protein
MALLWVLVGCLVFGPLAVLPLPLSTSNSLAAR